MLIAAPKKLLKNESLGPKERFGTIFMRGLFFGNRRGRKHGMENELHSVCRSLV